MLARYRPKCYPCSYVATVAGTGPRTGLYYRERPVESSGAPMAELMLVPLRGFLSSSDGRRRGRPQTTATTTTLLVLLLISLCSAEEIFHRRDHSDQGDYSESQVIYTVQTFEDALKYLYKYGYLNCTVSRNKRNIQPREASISTSNLVSLGDLAEESQVIRPSCTDSEIKDAFRTMQDKFGLSPTGEFSAETQRTMSSSRCGNSDTDSVPASPNSLDKESTSKKQTTASSSKSRVRRRALDALRAIAGDDQKNFIPHVDLPRLKEVVIDKSASRKRRHAMLHELKRKYSEDSVENPIVRQSSRESKKEKRLARRISRLKRPSVQQRRKRTIGQFTPDEVTEEGRSTTRFEQQDVCWRLLDTGISHRIPAQDQEVFLELSFRRFSEVCPIKFKQCKTKPYSDVDILIAFGREDHQNCDKPFDGNGGELAHSWIAGNIHFDDAENYKSLQDSQAKEGSPSGISLLKVAVHEIGHVIGLSHVNNENSIMYPIYHNMEDNFEISRDDRRAVQQLYGVCKGRFDVVMDWVRKKYSPGDFTPGYKYNSYFFRGDSYWLYENPEDRPRYGDPLEVQAQWTGVPSNMDGYTQIFTPGRVEYDISTYFFKGDHYYKYDDVKDRVHPEYPRRISDDFGPKPGSNERIPNNIDSVLFDPRDLLLYFFKGEWVWTYDPKLIGQPGCCESKHRFVDLFPVASESGDPLLGHVDAVYRSFSNRIVYFFVDEVVYENRGFRSGTPGDNLLLNQGPWYDIWHDICDPRS